MEVVAGLIPTPQRRKGRISRFRADKLQAGRGGMVVTVVEMVDGEACPVVFVITGTNARGTSHGETMYRLPTSTSSSARCERQPNQSPQKLRYPPLQATESN